MSDNEIQILDKNRIKEAIPTYIFGIAEQLQQNGYEAYLVGGSVRDILLGKIPSDFDVATNAYPEIIEKIFPKSIPTGAQFGTMTVVVSDKNGERFDVEVTTYRSEEDYVGGRWPAKVEFTKTIEEDLARRDFTINAIAIDLQNFDTDMPIEALIKDPFAGLNDLKIRVIRAVNNPVERFSEDGLRPIRACRLAAQLEFQIEPETFSAIEPTNYISAKVSVERLREELTKLLLKSPKPSIGLMLMHKSGLLKLIIPELEEGIGVTQPEFHLEDVFSHSLKSCDLAEDSIKLAALLHDIAKPRCMTKDEFGVHFYGHDTMGAEMTREIMKRLKYSNAEIERTANLVRWHMFYYPSADWRKELDAADEINRSSGLTDHDLLIRLQEEDNAKMQGGWTDGAVRRFIRNVGGPEQVTELMKLRIADATSNPKSPFNPKEIDVLSLRVSKVLAEDAALKLEDLDIDGKVLMGKLGIPAGPLLGQTLNYLLEQVIDDPKLNRSDILLNLAQQFIESQTTKL